LLYKNLNINFFYKSNPRNLYNDIRKELLFLNQNKKDFVNVCLTGGVSFNKLQTSIIKRIFDDQNSNYYLTDERLDGCIKNFDLINSLEENKLDFKNINPKYFNTKNKFIKYFNNNLPKKLDILFLSFGSRGHIASLFYDNDCLSNKKSIVTKSHESEERISISYKYILNSHVIYLFILSKEKINEFKSLYNNPKYSSFLKSIINRSNIYTFNSLKEYLQ